MLPEVASEWSQRDGGGALITPVTRRPMDIDVGGLRKSNSSLAGQWREKGKEVFAGPVMAVLQVAAFPLREKMWSVWQRKL